VKPALGSDGGTSMWHLDYQHCLVVPSEAHTIVTPWSGPS
jgi:hypothetical protein